MVDQPMVLVGLLSFLSGVSLLGFAGYSLTVHILNWRESRDSHKTI